MRKVILFTTVFVFTFLFSDLIHADAREQILYDTTVITQKSGIDRVFYTKDGKITVEVDISSFQNNTKNNGLSVSLLRPVLGGYYVSTNRATYSTGKSSFAWDFGREGYYKIQVGLAGPYGLSTPVKINAKTRIFD